MSIEKNKKNCNYNQSEKNDNSVPAREIGCLAGMIVGSGLKLMRESLKTVLGGRF